MPGIDAFTKLCLHMDGADGSTSFPDISASAHTVTAVGNAQVDTAQSKFGGASYLGDGSGDALQLPAHADFAFGTGDFVIDFWVRPASSPLNGIALYDGRAADYNGGIALFTQGSGTTGALRLFVSPADVITGTTVLAANTWYHVALVRSSGTTRLFLNGVQEGSNYTDANNYSVGSTGPSVGARNSTYTASLSGWIDELRVSKGTDRGWASGFTPPTGAYSGASARTHAMIMG